MNLLRSKRFVLEVAGIVIGLPFVIVFILLSHIYKFLFKNRTPKSVDGEIAVVTGGGNGLGREICFKLADKGCHVAVVDIDEVGANKTVELLKSRYNVKAKAYKVDIANHDEVMQLSKNVTNDLGDVTILVNNAGILCFPSYPPQWQDVQNLINVNLTGHFWTNRAFLPKMKELKKGHIVAISSLAGLFPLIYFSEYSATKAGVHSLMRTLRLELSQEKHKNIHLTTIYPYMLKSNPKVVSIYEKSELHKDYPMIRADRAAKVIVDAMLLNVKEVTLPSISKYLHMLFSSLPTELQDWMTLKKIEGKVTKDILT